MTARRRKYLPLGNALLRELAGIVGIALAWLAMFWEAKVYGVESWQFFVASLPFALAWLAKLACWMLIAARYRTASIGWVEAVSLAFGIAAVAAWLAQIGFLLDHLPSNDPAVVPENLGAIFQNILWFDALPPGIVAGGMFIAASIARHRQSPESARLLEFGGLMALALSILFTIGMGHAALASNDFDERAYLDFVELAVVAVGVKIAWMAVIGGIRWGHPHFAVRERADRGSRTARNGWYNCRGASCRAVT